MTALLSRILLVFHSPLPSAQALESVRSLAQVKGSELSGLYIENIEMLEAATLHFLWAVDTLSGKSKSLSTKELETKLSQEAALAQKLLAKLAQTTSVNSHFQTARGTVFDETLRVAAEGSLIVLSRKKLGSTLVIDESGQKLLSQTRFPLLFLGRGWLQGMPALIYEGSEESKKALSLGLALARAKKTALLVLLPAHLAQLSDALPEMAQSFPIHFRILPLMDAPHLVAALKNEKLSLLILPESLLNVHLIDEIGSLLDLSVLVLR